MATTIPPPQARSALLRGSLRASVRGLSLVTPLIAGCSFFSQTPDVKTRQDVRAAVNYGDASEGAASRLAGLGYVCTRSQGNYTAEDGRIRSAEHFLNCEERPGVVSFACQNRDFVTLVLRDDRVSAIEVVRGPSCERN